ncbi:MAG: hypothetical protein QF473_32330, partial [Planctomycetota bacterium]|nr:hypothetical protein [Planctomycetota bacterium]
PQLPEVPPESTETRSGLLRVTDQVYSFREQALENAYALVQEMKELHQTREISALLMAEHLATAASAASPQLTATQLSSWEKLSKEYGSLPVFYEKVIPVRKQRVKAVEALRRRMTVNPEDLSERLPRELADEVSTILQQTSRRLEQLRISEARALVNAAYEKLRKAGQERSLRLRIVVANKYRKPLNVKLTLTAHWPGTKTELYSDYPCTTDDATSEIIAHLPTKPAAIVLTTTPWTGSLPVRVWELSNSRDAFRPGKATESSHVAGLEEWLEDNQTGFTISPWSGRAHVRFIY